MAVCLMLIAFMMSACAKPTAHSSDHQVQTTQSQGHVAFEQNGKWGFKDKSGKTIIAPQYEYAWDFGEDSPVAKITQNQQIGVIDHTGKMIVWPQYDDAGSFSEGLLWVKQGEKYGFINEMGDVVIPLEYDFVFDFSQGLAGVAKDDK